MQVQEIHQMLADSLITLKGTLSLFANPTNTLSVYDIEDGLRHQKATTLSIQFLLDQPGIQEIVTERYLAPTPDIEALLQCPVGSLGHTYATYITSHGFDANFFRTLSVEDDTSYLFLRRRQTHDLWHIVAGFDINEESEIGLKAFELAQTRSMMSALLIAGGLIRTLFKYPERLDYLLDRIAVGYRIGAKAHPFLAQKWELEWSKPLSQWQRELNVTPMPVYQP
jgi:ubiquinone biosynthesis protein Coq4